MFAFFDLILGYLETIWNLVVGLVSSLLMAIKFVITGTDAIVYLSGFLPAVIGGCVIIFLAVAILKFVLGR